MRSEHSSPNRSTPSVAANEVLLAQPTSGLHKLYSKAADSIYKQPLFAGMVLGLAGEVSAEFKTACNPACVGINTWRGLRHILFRAQAYRAGNEMDATLRLLRSGVMPAVLAEALAGQPTDVFVGARDRAYHDPAKAYVARGVLAIMHQSNARAIAALPPRAWRAMSGPFAAVTYRLQRASHQYLTEHWAGKVDLKNLPSDPFTLDLPPDVCKIVGFLGIRGDMQRSLEGTAMSSAEFSTSVVDMKYELLAKGCPPEHIYSALKGSIHALGIGGRLADKRAAEKLLPDADGTVPPNPFVADQIAGTQWRGELRDPVPPQDISWHCQADYRLRSSGPVGEVRPLTAVATSMLLGVEVLRLYELSGLDRTRTI